MGWVGDRDVLASIGAVESVILCRLSLLASMRFECFLNLLISVTLSILLSDVRLYLVEEYLFVLLVKVEILIFLRFSLWPVLRLKTILLVSGKVTPVFILLYLHLYIV